MLKLRGGEPLQVATEKSRSSSGNPFNARAPSVAARQKWKAAHEGAAFSLLWSVPALIADEGCAAARQTSQ
jgi:hypothetical protein